MTTKKKNLIIIEKNGIQIAVHPDTLASHLNLGWWAVKPQSDPAPDFDLATASVEAVLAAVKDGVIGAAEALEYEQFNGKRTSLLKKLTKLVAASEAA